MSEIRVHGRANAGPLALKFWTSLFVALLFLEVQGSSQSLGQTCRLAIATCSKFPWVNDLPETVDTASFLQSCFQQFSKNQDSADIWQNGSSREFLNWTQMIARKGNPKQNLILYFSTHQRSDGRTRFSDGQDLSPSELIGALNDLAKNYQRVLFINDSCYAANLEKKGAFAENIVRLYSAQADEIALDLQFGKGPFGLSKFIEEDLKWLRSELNWTGKGMSFVTLMALKAGRIVTTKKSDLDIGTLFIEMKRCRDLYDEQVRQSKVPHFVLVPADARFPIFATQSHGK